MCSLVFGGLMSKFNPNTKARTNIILPAIYRIGKHSSAESPADKLKKVAVLTAEAYMAVFGMWISFGFPVEPEVCKAIYSYSLSQLIRKYLYYF